MAVGTHGHPSHAALHAPRITPVIEWVKAWGQAGARIVVMTSRSESDHALTVRLLDDLGIMYDELLMRQPGDHRIDTALKRDMHNNLAVTGYITAIDDNPYIVDMWSTLGLGTILVPGWDFNHRGPIYPQLPKVTA